MRSLKFFLPLLASTLCFAAQPDRIAGPIDAGQAVALPKSLHAKAQPQYDLGAADPSLKLGYMTLLMGPSATQQKALDQLLIQLQDRRSPNYHKWLTPQQFADSFGLTQNDLNKITAWLKSEGFQILKIGGGRNLVVFSGTAAQVRSAFGTEIHNYRVNGEPHISNSSPVMIPAALNGIVRSVMGLQDFRPQPAYRSRIAASHRAHPDYYDPSFLFPNFIAPGDMATIYDINKLYNLSPAIDGTGQTLAIAGQTDILLADINDFRSGFGLNPIPTGTGGCTTSASGIIIAPCNTTNFSYVLLGDDPGTVSAGDIGEADLDVEWSGAVARNAQIIFVNGQTSNGVFDALTDILDPGVGLPPLAPVVSISYGEGCEAQATLDFESLFQQANTEGVTIMNSSGDVGSATCDFNPPNSTPPYEAAVGGLGVSYPASSPEVTAVGGTEITIADDPNPAALPYWSTTIGANGGTAQEYIPEIAWNDDVQFGAFCGANVGQYTFCDPSPGVLITNAQTFQDDYWISSSGGGASNCWYENGTMCLGPGPGPTTGGGFPQPIWQQGLSVAGAPSGVRWVPDVSFMASPNFPGYIFCTPQDPPGDNTSTCFDGIFTAVDTYESLVGGTSVSSPSFAGMMALLNQYVVANGLQSTPGLGNVNTMLYTLAANSANGAFNPVTSGDNNVYCQINTPAGQPTNVQCPAAGVMGYSASSFDATTHYNLVTGLGSVDVDNLFLAWLGSANAQDFTLSTANDLAPSSVPAGQSAVATLTIAPVNGSTQTINFTPSSCSGLAGATCSFSPTSVTLDGTDSQKVTVTITTAANMTLPTGPQTITVTGSASGGASSSHNTPITLTVTPTNQSYTLSSTNGASFNISVGGTATVDFTVNGAGSPISFVTGNSTALPVTYTCSGIPASAEIFCNFNPNQGQSITTATPTLSLVTTGVTTQVTPLGGSRIFYALLLPGLFGVVLVAGSRTRAARLLSLMVVLGCSTLWLGSCGGSSGGNSQSNPGTPPGTYTVTITGTTAGPVFLTTPVATPFTVTLIVAAQ
jgi:hypothetical protein